MLPTNFMPRTLDLKAILVPPAQGTVSRTIHDASSWYEACLGSLFWTSISFPYSAGDRLHFIPQAAHEDRASAAVSTGWIMGFCRGRKWEKGWPQLESVTAFFTISRWSRQPRFRIRQQIPWTVLPACILRMSLDNFCMRRSALHWLARILPLMGLVASVPLWRENRIQAVTIKHVLW